LAKNPAIRRIADVVAGPLAERPFPELAEALRSRIKPLLQEWEKLVRQHVPPASKITFDGVLDGLPDILRAMADALASGDAAEVKRLMQRSPEQGIHRFQIHHDVGDLATEDRILRWLIVESVADALGRAMIAEEAAALNWAIDLMSQQAMIAFVTHQDARLRAAAESEVQYLSFLSHDLSGSLGNVTLWLQILRRKLGTSPQFAEEVSALDTAQQAILDTMGGMGRLLQAERLRHLQPVPKVGPVGLRDLSRAVAGEFAKQAEQKGVTLVVEAPSEAVVNTEAELVRLVLQNLIANAVKYSSWGTIRVTAEQQQDGRQGAWALSVSDEGPGIAPEHVTRIFEAFRRGEMHGQSGVGLGLAIASRAARLLGAELTVESELGKGSRFSLVFPARAERR
jgi:signal transduction histidine kinase